MKGFIPKKSSDLPKKVSFTIKKPVLQVLLTENIQNDFLLEFDTKEANLYSSNKLSLCKNILGEKIIIIYNELINSTIFIYKGRLISSSINQDNISVNTIKNILSFSTNTYVENNISLHYFANKGIGSELKENIYVDGFNKKLISCSFGEKEEEIKFFKQSMVSYLDPEFQKLENMARVYYLENSNSIYTTLKNNNIYYILKLELPLEDPNPILNINNVSLNSLFDTILQYEHFILQGNIVTFFSNGILNKNYLFYNGRIIESEFIKKNNITSILSKNFNKNNSIFLGQISFSNKISKETANTLFFINTSGKLTVFTEIEGYKVYSVQSISGNIEQSIFGTKIIYYNNKNIKTNGLLILDNENNTETPNILFLENEYFQKKFNINSKVIISKLVISGNKLFMTLKSGLITKDIEISKDNL